MERLESVAPFLNTPWWSSRPSAERSGEIPNGNKPCAEKGKRHPVCDEGRVAALSGKGKASKNGRVKELEAIESGGSVVPIWMKGIWRSTSFFPVPGFPCRPPSPGGSPTSLPFQVIWARGYASGTADVRSTGTQSSWVQRFLPFENIDYG